MPSDCGFSNTGFMSIAGGAPQARACKACARPISPPSAVTAALFDMFCGLSGRTLRPRRVNTRASPATSSDFPTSEPVPCSIKARVIETVSPATPPRGRACPGHPRLGRGAVRGREDVDARNKSGQGEWGKTSKFDPRLRLDASAERVLDERHLGDEVGGLDQFGGRVAAGHNDVQIARLSLQRR